jgi:type I restriction enzyme M protein
MTPNSDDRSTMPKKQPKKKNKKVEQPKTTAQQLSSLIKSARDIMRKDKGLNGDLDRLPLLTWIMFLKFLDDREKLEEARAAIAGKKYKSAIAPPYRWRDWAAYKEGITGDELVAFVNQDEAIRPDGKRGAGLLAYLRNLRSTNGDRRRDVIANVFEGVINRMISGYLMRDVINLVDGIHFDSSEEIHTLARLYESMLREMRDAAGDSGEFYTPRPVIQFMVAVTDPELGEVVLDPACGTGGFLAEVFAYLEKQCKTVQQRKVLQERSIRGGEAKPLPYMLSQMNLLLHGLNAPSIEYGNSLAVKLTELGDRDRVDVILTNPPFGGEEEAGIRNNFPADKQTNETALLFLQLIMRKLRRPVGNTPAGRAGVIVPDGVLFGDGVCARVKQELLTQFRLHTVVRMPNGVFQPYTPIPTNILFFDGTKPTDHVWFYKLVPPEGRKHYTKTKPLQFADFGNLLQWWKRRRASDHAWRLSLAQLTDVNFNLDQRHPSENDELPIESPSQVLASILEREQQIHTLLQHLRKEVENT